MKIFEAGITITTYRSYQIHPCSYRDPYMPRLSRYSCLNIHRVAPSKTRKYVTPGSFVSPCRIFPLLRYVLLRPTHHWVQLQPIYALVILDHITLLWEEFLTWEVFHLLGQEWVPRVASPHLRELGRAAWTHHQLGRSFCLVRPWHCRYRTVRRGNLVRRSGDASGTSKTR